MQRLLLAVAIAAAGCGPHAKPAKVSTSKTKPAKPEEAPPKSLGGLTINSVSGHFRKLRFRARDPQHVAELGTLLTFKSPLTLVEVFASSPSSITSIRATVESPQDATEAFTSVTNLVASEKSKAASDWIERNYERGAVGNVGDVRLEIIAPNRSKVRILIAMPR